MTNDEIKELIDYCETKNLMYFEFVNNDKKIVFSKYEIVQEVNENAKSKPVHEPFKTTVTSVLEDDVMKLKKVISQKVEAVKEHNNENDVMIGSNLNIVQIKSPYVGIITFSEKILKGDIRVKEKTELCSIEAMKIYNGIVSPVNGTIKEIFIDDGSLVEYDQLIMNIEANEI